MALSGRNRSFIYRAERSTAAVSAGYLHAVVLFKALAHRAEHFQTVAARRLGYLHRLEPALERCVLFDMTAVLLGRGRADYLHLAPAERRL